MTKVALIGATLAGLLLSAGAHAATIVTNGSFEDTTNFSSAGHPADDDTDSLPNGSTDMTGWTVAPSSIAWIGPDNHFGLAASEGGYFLDLTDYSGAPFGGVSQTIATVSGQKYTVSFDLGSSSTYGLPAAILATAGSASQTFTSTLIGSSNWETELLSFVATGGTTVISFAGSVGSNFIGLDNVSVSATPLPASALMFGTALLALGFGGYRRMKQNAAA